MAVIFLFEAGRLLILLVVFRGSQMASLAEMNLLDHLLELESIALDQLGLNCAVWPPPAMVAAHSRSVDFVTIKRIAPFPPLVPQAVSSVK
ncbi:hypothetical protein MVEN_00493100 [Mycena venus]|uniref:Secreted protein n=1 Tax=Mycena venus TaxID=2733690 RepID=A0A8H7DC29_9AGAR|nr:hypothetical protein MVEN_00493100 [Mycena venus]